MVIIQHSNLLQLLAQIPLLLSRWQLIQAEYRSSCASCPPRPCNLQLRTDADDTTEAQVLAARGLHVGNRGRRRPPWSGEAWRCPTAATPLCSPHRCLKHRRPGGGLSPPPPRLLTRQRRLRGPHGCHSSVLTSPLSPAPAVPW